MVKDPNCKNKNWKLPELDEVIFNEIRKLATDPEYFNAIRQEKKDNNNEPNKIEILETEIKSLNEQISRFMDLYGIGKFTIEQVSDKVDPLNERRSALEKELESLNATSEELSQEETIEIATTFSDVLDRGDLNEIRLAIESLIYYIEIDEDDVYIHWKFA